MLPEVLCSFIIAIASKLSNSSHLNEISMNSRKMTGRFSEAENSRLKDRDGH